MRVFLSSTYDDLKNHREQVAQAVERLGQQPDRMETFGARPEQPKEACLREIDVSDVFVGIYAHCYGYVPAGSDMSITESEFRHAKSKGKPILCFVVDKDHPWPPPLIEDEPGRTKLKAFKKEIDADFVRDKFTTPEDLALKVSTALGRYLTSRLEPLTSDLRDLVQQISNVSADERQVVADTLSAAVDIALRTLRYIAQQRRSGQRDTEEEGKLSRGWQDAGAKLTRLPKPQYDLANRYFIKAEYWAYPESWTAERVKKAQIDLDELYEESRTVLLGMQRGQ